MASGIFWIMIANWFPLDTDDFTAGAPGQKNGAEEAGRGYSGSLHNLKLASM